MWFLRWTPHALLEGLDPLLGTYLNVPDGVNLMWNTSLPLPAALMTPVTVHLGLPVTVTALYTLALALSAWFASIAFRRYVRGYPAALLGGLVYGFSPAMIAQSSSHLHLTLGAVLPPLMLLAVDELLHRQRRNPLLVGAGLGALAAAQVLIGEELLAFTGIACAIMLAALLVLYPRHVPGRAGRALLGIGAAALVFAVLAAWPLAFQFLGPQRIAGAIQETSRNGNDLYSFVVPTRIMAVTPAAALQVSGRFVGRVGELNGYLGIPLVGLLAFTVARWWRSGVVRVAFVTGMVMLVLSMGERLHVDGRILDVPLPWAAMKSLPLVESAIPTRFMLTANLFFGLLLAIFVDQARRRAIGGRGCWPWSWSGRRWWRSCPGSRCGPSRWPRRRSSPAPRCGASPRAPSPWWRRSRPPRRRGRWPGRPWPACATACPAATSSVPTPTAGPSSAPSAPGCRAG